MTSLGAFNLVLHCHAPFLRQAGRWRKIEDQIHDQIASVLIPLLHNLYQLRDDEVPFHLTLAISPVLAEQLASADLATSFEAYLERKIEAAALDMRLFAETGTEGELHQPDSHLRYLAEWYHKHFTSIKHDFTERLSADLIGALRSLQDSGHIELATSAATYAYLPLLSNDSTIFAQLKAAVTTHRRLFGRDPVSIWLPECAYRPGLEHLLAANGLKVFFVEPHAISGGPPVGVPAGDVIGPHDYLRQHYTMPRRPYPEPREVSVFRPYYVPAGGSEVIALGRENRSVMQVWSTGWGYPGDVDYREIARHFGTSNLRYWRITGHKVDMAHKDYYHPDWAFYKVDQHAEHFAHFLGDLLREHNRNGGGFGIISAHFDVRLFGHWWFEGPQWLVKILRHLADSADIELATASAIIDAHPPTDSIDLPDSSWGYDGLHFAWDNIETHWMWPVIHQAEARMVALTGQFNQPDDDTRAVLNQAARELLLLQSADWTFWIITGGASEYALERFSEHNTRFNTLADSLEAGQPDRAAADQWYTEDYLFPDIDYRWFNETPTAQTQDEG